MTPDEIRRRRDELGLTQAQLGEALGVHGNTVAKWERGEQNPEHPEMLRLALDRLREQQAGDTEDAAILDKLARKINAALSNQGAMIIPGFGKPKKQSWRDVPSVLTDLRAILDTPAAAESRESEER